MSKVAIGVIFLAISCSVECGERQRHLCSPPVTYILTYSNRHVGYPEFIEEVRRLSPMLLHLGKDVVFTHNWGPIRAMGGENQAFGKGDYIKRLTPAEVRERIAKLKKFTRALHDAGARIVVPYICCMTIGGDEKARRGFWEFYDHWDEYAEFELGPRPELDPIDWMQRTPDGSLQRFYKYSGPFYPPYEPNQRDAACVNNPCWRHWLDKVAEWVARVGYDGVFVDNSPSQRCYCRFCAEKFRKYIIEKYGREGARSLFGNEIKLGTREEGGLPWVEAQRFWLLSVRRHLACIRKAGEKFARRFYIFPNGGRPDAIKIAFTDCDFVMYERSLGEFGTHPGMALFKVVEDITIKRYNDHVFDYKFVQCLRANVRPIVLSRGGYPRTEKWLDMNPSIAELGMAEAAAFGNGGGFLVRLRLDCAEPMRKYRRFFEAHADLYEGTDSYAPVAIAAFPEQKLYGNRDHMRIVMLATEQLLDSHIPFDYVVEEDFDPGFLGRYSAIILPRVEYMSDGQISALREFVRAGGVAVIIGRCGAYDELCRPRKEEPFADSASRQSGGLRTASLGRGTVALTDIIPPDYDWLADRLERLTGKELRVISGEAPALRKVRVNIFRRAGRGEYMIHVVNYNVALGRDAAAVTEFRGVRFRLNLEDLPGDVKIESFSPDDEEPTALSFEREGNVVGFTLPRLHIYHVIRVGSK